MRNALRFQNVYLPLPLLRQHGVFLGSLPDDLVGFLEAKWRRHLLGLQAPREFLTLNGISRSLQHFAKYYQVFLPVYSDRRDDFQTLTCCG